MLCQRNVTLSILVALVLGAGMAAERAPQAAGAATSSPTNTAVDRSPIDLVLTPDEKWLVTANQTSNTLSLVNLAEGVVVAEISCGQKPVAVAITPNGKQILATTLESGELLIYSIDGNKIARHSAISLGFEPHGVAVSPDGKLAYVALTAANKVAVIDLATKQVASQIDVGRWPRYLAVSPDGKRLGVGTSGDGGVSVVDTETRDMLFQSKFVGLNIGHLFASADNKYVYFPWMTYGDRPISPGNIQQGWVMGNRLARVRLDEKARREAIALDPRGKAVADPFGVGITPDQEFLVSTASGSHELVVFKLPEISFLDDGPGDHMEPSLVRNNDRFFRIPLGGRPMGLKIAKDGRHVFVANYLSNSVQVVDLKERRIAQTISLGSAVEPSLARKGEAIFYDAQRSVDQWYSCSSCHYEGHTNTITMDTRNDGSNGTYKMVLSLRNVTNTGPYFWHGWQKDLAVAVRRSMTESMQGPNPTDEEVSSVLAFLGTLAPPPNPHRNADGSLTAAAERGKLIFEGNVAACSSCHKGPQFSDGEIHDVGLGSMFDVYKGYNTPTLLGAHNRAGYLHHGRAKTLEEVVTDLHSPVKVSGTRELTPEEVRDLVAYVNSL